MEKIIGTYGGYTLTKINNSSVVWSDENSWLDCVFDGEETARYFIDLKQKFADNFYSVIAEAQKIAIDTNDGLVSIDIINGFELKI